MNIILVQVEHFLRRILKLADECNEKISSTNIQLPPTDEEKQKHENSTACEYCKTEYTELNHKTYHHAHQSGRYLASLCNNCNLLCKPRLQLPVLAHNSSRFDNKLIVRGLTEKIVKNVQIIPKSNSNFLGIVLDSKVRLMDSFQFMDASLEKLTENLRNKEDDPEKLAQIFPYLADHFKNNQHLPLLCSKLPFPYEFMSDPSVFEPDVQLPPQSAFNNKLKNQDCSLDDYNIAVKVYEELKCESFHQFEMAYQAVDVLTLSQVFEHFRKKCMEEHIILILSTFGQPQDLHFKLL